MKKILLIILAVLITVSAAIYQKKTGPTYKKTFTFEYEDMDYELILPRSHAGKSDCTFDFVVENNKFDAKVYYKKFPTKDEFLQENLEKKGDTLRAVLPQQPYAGKLAYYVEICKDSDIIYSTEQKTLQIRFRGEVPAWAMLPHIIFIFLGMLFANISGLFAIFNIPFKKQVIYTFFLLLLGGMVFGPIVQNFAFGEYWAGIPNGWDLTDNKMLLGFTAWTIALIGNLKKPRKAWVIIAAVVILVIFSIPHSFYGSEYNHKTGEVIQG